MPKRLWRIYRSEPRVPLPGTDPLTPSNSEREVYLTTLSASSADTALTRYEELYGEKASYAIEDEDVTGSRLV